MSVHYSISPRKVRLTKDEDGNITYKNDETAETRYYANAQASGKMSFEQFAEHVAGHDSKYHKGDILAMIVEVMRCMKEELLNGKQIELSDLGVFSLTLMGTGAPSITDFSTSANIQKVKVHWTPGKDFDDLRNDRGLELVQVLTKEEEAAIKKAKREASPSVKDPNGTGGGTTTNGKYTIKAVPNNTTYGSVTGGGEFSMGSSITLTAVAKSGYKFSAWSDGVSTATRNVTVTGNATYTANFVVDSGSITPPSMD